jgi:hypothetical protein
MAPVAPCGGLAAAGSTRYACGDTLVADPSFPSPAASIRRDIVDLIRLMRFVKERRAALAAVRESTAPADELLATLDRQIRIVWRSRFDHAAVRAGRGAGAPHAPTGAYVQV